MTISADPNSLFNALTGWTSGETLALRATRVISTSKASRYFSMVLPISPIADDQNLLAVQFLLENGRKLRPFVSMNGPRTLC